MCVVLPSQKLSYQEGGVQHINGSKHPYDPLEELNTFMPKLTKFIGQYKTGTADADRTPAQPLESQV